MSTHSWIPESILCMGYIAFAWNTPDLSMDSWVVAGEVVLCSEEVQGLKVGPSDMAISPRIRMAPLHRQQSVQYLQLHLKFLGARPSDEWLG